MSRVMFERNKATVAPGLAISCAAPVPSGDCFGGKVSGWHEDAFVLTVRAVEAGARDQGRSLKDMSLAEMDELWDKAKEGEKGQS